MWYKVYGGITWRVALDLEETEIDCVAIGTISWLGWGCS
jgi:hypothetical protein